LGEFLRSASLAKHKTEHIREEQDMRKVIIAILISAAFIVSGISGTTFTSGQVTSSAWAEGGA
jgi:hypothetical protein